MKKRHQLLMGLLAATVIFAGCAKQTDAIPSVIIPESSAGTSGAMVESSVQSNAAEQNAAGNGASSQTTVESGASAIGGGAIDANPPAAGNSAAGNPASSGSNSSANANSGNANNNSTASQPVLDPEAYKPTNVRKSEPVDPSTMYRSELTNEWIAGSLQNQRPVAVMVDNELYALPHYGVNDADVVYEIMNSTENNRVTRLMVIVKDWENIERLGSIRSTRTTNFMVAAEWNAILCHDGGPFYIQDYTSKPYVNNLSGGFARYSNGKATEFTEYVTYNSYTNTNKGQTYAGLGSRIKSAGYSTTYNDYYPGKHFNFSDEEFKLSDNYSTVAATSVTLNFPHNGSKLFYNTSTGTYDYYEYGEYHKDAATGGVTTFKNVILQSCSFYNLDANGYLTYNVVGSGDGYYITNGEAIPITWSKGSETGLTVFKNKATGQEITLNTGKTYIAIAPSDTWSQVTLK
ncbi:MAG: DUF3048 domain-containing protein [Lachnospiraceae bacterium]|nr:DUF3048 domain-containing protein [Lachnospiraceae bacterium]